MSVSDYFKGMSNAKPMAGGQYFKGEGKFLLSTKRMFVNDGHKGKFFVAEFEVKESTSSQDPAGVTRSWVAPLEGSRAKYSFGDIKNLVFAITGHNPKDVGEPDENRQLHEQATELVKAACDPEYAKKNNIDPVLLIDQDLRLETFSKQTKPTPEKPQGGTFTVHSWAPAE